MIFMKNTNFNDLLQRYLNGSVSEEEKIKLEAWLDARKDEDTKHMLLSEVEEEHLFQKISSRIDNVEEIKTLYPQPREALGRPKSKQQWLNKRTLGIAASFLILAIITFT